MCGKFLKVLHYKKFRVLIAFRVTPRNDVTIEVVFLYLHRSNDLKLIPILPKIDKT